jgi:hypothetical protein
MTKEEWDEVETGLEASLKNWEESLRQRRAVAASVSSSVSTSVSQDP